MRHRVAQYGFSRVVRQACARVRTLRRRRSAYSALPDAQTAFARLRACNMRRDSRVLT
jgi:hypothetical protein